MYTRIGIRIGVPSPRRSRLERTLTFVEEGIGLDEVGSHSRRDTQKSVIAVVQDPLAFAKRQTVREVPPVSATNNLEISMFVKGWRNAQLRRFNEAAKLRTKRFHSCNECDKHVPSATMVFTFPYVDGLRMANWTIQDETTSSDGTVNGVENLARRL